MQNLSPFAAQKALFRAYDIRGAQCYFTQGFVQALAQAFAQLYTTQHHNAKSHIQSQTQSSPTVTIGYDVRHGSDCIAKTVANTLQASGLKVIHLGLVTTPMAAFWAQQYDGHGIMVTASHSAKETLGIKWLVHNASPSHSEIQALYKQIANSELSSMADKSHKDKVTTSPCLPADTIANTYIETMVQVIRAIHPADKRVSNHKRSKDSLLLRNVSQPTSDLENKLDLTLVIDCLSGATSNIAKPLFERFCQRVIMLNDRPDGSFPTGNPDPTEPNRLAELQQTVIVNSADMGLAFDGDGDRLMIVDNSGKVVTPDHLLYLLAQVAITERQLAQNTTDIDKASDNTLTTPPVLFDVKCSHHLAKLLAALGAQPIMTRTGSSLLRQQLQTDQKQAIFAGELSGHFIFNDGYFIVYDDAMYAGLRLLNWLAFTAVPTAAQTDKIMLTTDLWGELRSVLPPYDLTDITQNLPNLVSTADHYLPLPNTQACEASVLEHLTAYCCYLQDLASAHRASTKADDTRLSPKDLSKKSVPCSCFNDSSSTDTETETHLPISALYSISIEQAQQLMPADTQISLIDGMRLDFANGFGVLRESNTSHSLTVRFAGDSTKDLQQVQARFVALCELFDTHLAQQIAAIEPE